MTTAAAAADAADACGAAGAGIVDVASLSRRRLLMRVTAALLLLLLLDVRQQCTHRHTAPRARPEQSHEDEKWRRIPRFGDSRIVSGDTRIGIPIVVHITAAGGSTTSSIPDSAATGSGIAFTCVPRL